MSGKFQEYTLSLLGYFFNWLCRRCENLPQLEVGCEVIPYESYHRKLAQR
jgi:hypothetical protein